jgi:hypothetical protein
VNITNLGLMEYRNWEWNYFLVIKKTRKKPRWNFQRILGGCFVYGFLVLDLHFFLSFFLSFFLLNTISISTRIDFLLCKQSNEWMLAWKNRINNREWRVSREEKVCYNSISHWLVKSEHYNLLNTLDLWYKLLETN